MTRDTVDTMDTVDTVDTGDRELSREEFTRLVTVMYEDGTTMYTVGDIASELGVGYSVVYRALRGNAVKMRSQGPIRTESGFRDGSKSARVAATLVTNYWKPRDSPRPHYTVIAKQEGCTRELVLQVRKKLMAMGKIGKGKAPLPERERKRKRK